jgi:hypothetical protein
LALAVRNDDIEAVGGKITTRRLGRDVVSETPNAARVRKPGTAAVPTTVRALLRTKTRRVIAIM